MEFVICKRCDLYDNCRENEFKHPLTKHNLPRVSGLTLLTKQLYNLMQIGVEFNWDNLFDTSNKVIAMLMSLTSHANSKLTNKMSQGGKENGNK